MAFRDVVRVEYDKAPNGAQEPQYATLISHLPCEIIYTGGDETFRGRQIEGHIRYVVEASYNAEWGRLRSNMRLVVLEGPDIDMILNVEYVNHRRKVGLDDSTQIYCKELD